MKPVKNEMLSILYFFFGKNKKKLKNKSQQYFPNKRY